MSDITIECKDLMVSYDLHSHKVSTLKEYVIMKTKRRLTKATKLALQGVDFHAKKGECVALIGHNGCGKSTLLKCIAGILLPNAGTIRTTGRIAPMIELGAGFDPEMTGRENVYLSCSLLGLIKSEIDQKIGEIEKFSELGEFFDAPVKTYSSGMYMRLGFACTTAIAAEIVLIDEILAVGDENFQKKCLKRMSSIRESGCTVVLVSHDLNTVMNMADRAYVIDQGKVVFDGDASKSIRFYHQLMEEKRFASLTPEEQAEEKRKDLLQQNSQGTTFGSKAKISNIEVVVAKKEDGRFNLNIALEARLFTDFSHNVVVGFSVNTSAGVRIFGGNTKNLPKKLIGDINSKGVYVVDFQFENLELASGKYFLTVGIHDHTLSETIDIQGQAATFTVSNTLDPNNFDHDIINAGMILANCLVEKKKVLA